MLDADEAWRPPVMTNPCMPAEVLTLPTRIENAVVMRRDFRVRILLPDAPYAGVT
jgi:hypothetical protein